MMLLMARLSGYGHPLSRPQASHDVTAVAELTCDAVQQTWRPDRFRQRVTVRNDSILALPGPVVLVLEGLPSGTRLRGTASPDRVSVPAGLAAGASVTLDLEFDSRSGKIRYTARVLAG